MGEFVKSYDIPQSEIAALGGGGGTIERIIDLPPAHDGWSVIVTPKHGGGGSPTNPNTVYKYHVGDNEFLETNPPSSNAAIVNQANVITRNDHIPRVKLEIAYSGTIPDGDTLVRLFMSRSN